MSAGPERIRKYLASIYHEFTLEFTSLHRVVINVQEIHQNRPFNQSVKSIARLKNKRPKERYERLSFLPARFRPIESA
jgi:hypothetical protein